MAGKIINPTTGKPFVESYPSKQMVSIRREILDVLKNKYDAAQNTSQNEQHWLMSDSLSPNASNDIAVRRKLRTRSRYETGNNGYLNGVTRSLCQDFLGSGPTLKITDDRFTDIQKRSIERRWLQRSKKIKLRKKLGQLRWAKCESGEGFLTGYNDKKLKHPIKTNRSVIECDQVSHFNINNLINKSNGEIDGVKVNRHGSATHYHVLNSHPGETQLTTLRPHDGKWVPADQVIHWFHSPRNALRGIPETTPTLPLWALLRRYTLAVVQNAEIAADFTILLKSLQPAATNPFSLSSSGEPSDSNSDNWFKSFPVDRGLMTVIPDGYDLDQLDPRQPIMNYDIFVFALVQEAIRPLMVPRNYALGSSNDSNMASGNLDRQIYLQAVEQERLSCNEEVLDKDLEEWWFEAIRIESYFEDDVSFPNIVSLAKKFQSLRDDPPEHSYHWDQVPEHVDPTKIANAISILHSEGHISDTDVQERRFNRPVEEHYANIKKQQEFRKLMGMSLAPGDDPSLLVVENDDDDDDRQET